MKSPCKKTCFDEVVILLACLLLFFSGHAARDNTQECILEERQALLDFKQAISYDSCGLLDSWTDQQHNKDCCRWDGVGCDDNTGRVISLDLPGTYDDQGYGCGFQGNISHSLVNLMYLQHLDLSRNYFPQPIPSFIGSLHSLKSLNLSNVGFRGEIPYHLANLYRLTSLDLSESDNYYMNRLYAESLGWLSNLTLLRDINLSGIYLGGATDWVQSMNNLSYLKVLNMNSCHLPTPVLYGVRHSRNSRTNSQICWRLFNLTTSSSHLPDYVDLPNNFLNSPISHLDLSSNHLTDFLFLGNIHTLSHLNLASNNIVVMAPCDFQNLKSLTHLDLSDNQLEGPIPSATFANMKALSYLDLSGNSFNGQIPSELGNIHSLSHLDLFHNQLQGPIHDAIGNLKALEFLRLSSNPFLSGSIPDSLALLPQLVYLDLSDCNLTGAIPSHLGTLRPLQYIDLSHNHLVGEIPSQFVNYSSLRFSANDGLCGEPLALCKATNSNSQLKILNNYFYLGLYLSIWLGFYVGF